MWKPLCAAVVGVVVTASVSNAQIIYEAMPARYEILPGYNPRLTFEQAARLASVSERPCVVIVNGDDVTTFSAPLLSGGPYRKMDGLYVRQIVDEPLYFRKRDLLPPEMLPKDRDEDVDRREGADETTEAAPVEPHVPARIGPAARPSDGKMQAGEIRIFPSKPSGSAPRSSDKSDQVTP